MGGSSSKKKKSKANNEEMEQPPASAKSHQAAPGTPQLMVNERNVDDQAYEQQVQKDFYKKSPKFKKDFAKKGQARKTPAYPTAEGLSVDNDASWANDGSDNSDDEKTNSSARTSGFLSPPSE